MKDTEFTPAPWLWDGEIGTDNAGMVVGVGQRRDGSPTLVFPNDADRALVLAAPDMFQALQAASEVIAKIKSDSPLRDEALWAYGNVRAALSKARGIDTTS